MDFSPFHFTSKTLTDWRVYSYSVRSHTETQSVIIVYHCVLVSVCALIPTQYEACGISSPSLESLPHSRLLCYIATSRHGCDTSCSVTSYEIQLVLLGTPANSHGRNARYSCHRHNSTGSSRWHWVFVVVPGSVVVIMRRELHVAVLATRLEPIEVLAAFLRSSSTFQPWGKERSVRNHSYICKRTERRSEVGFR